MMSGLVSNLIACSKNFDLSADCTIAAFTYLHALAALELIMFKRGILHVNDFNLDFSVIDAFLKPVCME